MLGALTLRGNRSVTTPGTVTYKRPKYNLLTGYMQSHQYSRHQRLFRTVVVIIFQELNNENYQKYLTYSKNILPTKLFYANALINPSKNL